MHKIRTNSFWLSIHEPKYCVKSRQWHCTTASGPLYQIMSVCVERKKTSLLYIQTNLEIFSRVERTPSTSTQLLAETEFRIHKTKQLLTYNGTRSQINPSHAVGHGVLPRLASRPVRCSHHHEISYKSVHPLLAKPPQKNRRVDDLSLSLLRQPINHRATATGLKTKKKRSGKATSA